MTQGGSGFNQNLIDRFLTHSLVRASEDFEPGRFYPKPPMQPCHPLKPSKANSIHFNIQSGLITLSTEKPSQKVDLPAFAQIIMILRNEEEKANCQPGNDM